jgi:hypothetical protein
VDDKLTTANADNANADNIKKKKDKVRSAWISFAGRIVAQLVGAVATVALGVMVLHRYTALDPRPPAAEPAVTAQTQPVAAPGPSAPVVNVIVITPEMLALRDADKRFRPVDRGCIAPVDGPSSSTAHFDLGPVLPR